MLQGASLLSMRQLDWVSSSTEILQYLSGQRVDHTPVVTSEAFQLYLLPRLNFNLILQWVEAQESYHHVAGIFLVSHAALQCAGCTLRSVHLLPSSVTHWSFCICWRGQRPFVPCHVSWLETPVSCSDASILYAHRIFRNSAVSSWY